VFARRRGCTILADAYAEPPFRVGRCFPEGDGLHMILASSAPGIFAGDAFEQVIRVEDGAKVRLTSQSALQVHPPAQKIGVPLGDENLRRVRLESDQSRCSAALPLAAACGRQPDASEFLSTYQVGEGATLHCLWDPLIPFSGSAFRQRIDVHLAETAVLYWSDAFMAGRAFADRRSEWGARAGTGERWAFESIAHELRVARAHTLEYLERYRIVPNEGRQAHEWVSGHSCYFGTTVLTGPSIDSTAVEALHAELTARDEGVWGAADLLEPKLLIVRMMASSGVSFHRARALVANRLIGRQLPLDTTCGGLHSDTSLPAS
jgi:urease accessory protein UreH